MDGFVRVSCLVVSSNLPVMVWIHEGGFMSGDSMGISYLEHYLYDGQEIADRGNVVLVSVAYRLGVLGFLSTGDSNLPGQSSFHLSIAKGKSLHTSSCRHKPLRRFKVAFVVT